MELLIKIDDVDGGMDVSCVTQTPGKTENEIAYAVLVSGQLQQLLKAVDERIAATEAQHKE